MDLNSQSLDIVSPVSAAREIGEVKLDLIPALVQSHRHCADERLHPRGALCHKNTMLQTQNESRLRGEARLERSQMLVVNAYRSPEESQEVKCILDPRDMSNELCKLRVINEVSMTGVRSVNRRHTQITDIVRIRSKRRRCRCYFPWVDWEAPGSLRHGSDAERSCRPAPGLQM